MNGHATWLYQAGLLVRELRLETTRPRLHRLSAASVGPASLRDALIEQRDEVDSDRPPRLRNRLNILAGLISPEERDAVRGEIVVRSRRDFADVHGVSSYALQWALTMVWVGALGLVRNSKASKTTKPP